MGRAALAACLAFLLPTLPAPLALADVGDGLRPGSFLLHPAVFLEFRYDSNVFRDSARDEDVTQVAAPLLRLLPELSLRTQGGAKAELRGKAQLELRQYLDDDPVVSEQTSIGAHVSLDGELGKGSVLGLAARERFHYQPEAGTHQVSLTNVPTYDRLLNTTEISARIRPGGGALEMAPGYQLDLERFPDYPVADLTIHTLQLRGRWRFMPKTALTLHGSYGWRMFDNDYIPDANPVRATAGLIGLLTNRFSLELDAGYGRLILEEGEDPQGPIGGLSATYRLTERLKISTGYAREFKSTTWSSYADSHLFFGKWRQQIAGQWQVLAGASYELVLFSPLLNQAAGTALQQDVIDGRQDGILRAEASVEWRPNEWFSAALGYNYERRATDAAARIVNIEGTADVLSYADYDRHLMFSKVGFVY